MPPNSSGWTSSSDITMATVAKTKNQTAPLRRACAEALSGVSAHAQTRRSRPGRGPTAIGIGGRRPIAVGLERRGGGHREGAF